MDVDVTSIAQELIDALLDVVVKTPEKELLRQGAIVGVNMLYEALRAEFEDRGGKEKELDHGQTH